MRLIGVLYLLPIKNIKRESPRAAGKEMKLVVAFAAPAPLIVSVRSLSRLKSKDLKSGASLIPLQRAEDTGDASKKVSLTLKKRDDEIADNARQKQKRLRQRIPSVVTTAAAKASLKAKTSDSQ
jgi:hypothetical protein